MNARGWYLQDKGQQEATAQTMKNGWESLIEEKRQLCAREDLQPHFSKTRCKPEDATLEQLADKSRITPSEKEVFLKAKSEAAAIDKRMNEYLRQSDPRNGNTVALARERTIAELDKIALDFYQGRITRGEYNKKRREIAQQGIEQVRVATAH
jgi:hypothetical protein